MKLPFAFAIIFCNTLSSQICFNNVINYSTDILPNEIVAADVNNDGNNDLLTCNGGASISLLLNNGTGFFLPKIDYNLTGGGPCSIISKHLDIPYTYLDIAISNSNGSMIDIKLNSGGGNFSTTQTTAIALSPLIAQNPLQLLCDDFNNDGYNDFITANGSNNFSLLIGGGSGNFPTIWATHHLIGQQQFGDVPASITSNDFNVDGNKDLAIVSWFSQTLYIYLGDGTGNFSLTNTIGLTGGNEAVINGDFNNDNKIDLAIASYGNYVSIFIGDGAGNFILTNNFPIGPGLDPVDLKSGDFNQDGNDDIATANINSDDVSILLGDGNGNFTFANNYIVGDAPHSIVISDLNGDNKLDIATANVWSDNISVLINCSSLSSISEGNNKNQIIAIIYPNPLATYQNLFIKLISPLENAMVKIVNAMGQIVFEKKINALTSNATITLSDINLPTGIYYLTIETKENRTTQKLIISK